MYIEHADVRGRWLERELIQVLFNLMDHLDVGLAYRRLL
jgi:hypothetical protein